MEAAGNEFIMYSPFPAICSPQKKQGPFLAQNRLQFAEKAPISPSVFRFLAGTGIWVPFPWFSFSVIYSRRRLRKNLPPAHPAVVCPAPVNYC